MTPESHPEITCPTPIVKEKGVFRSRLLSNFFPSFFGNLRKCTENEVVYVVEDGNGKIMARGGGYPFIHHLSVFSECQKKNWILVVYWLI